MTIVHVLLARLGAGAFEFELTPEAEFDFAGSLHVGDLEEFRPEIALERAFAIANSYPEEMHCDASFIDEVEAWRDNGNRSLSVGDVVALGEVFWFCDSFGWQQIVPTPNIMTAFTDALTQERN